VLRIAIIGALLCGHGFGCGERWVEVTPSGGRAPANPSLNYARTSGRWSKYQNLIAGEDAPIGLNLEFPQPELARLNPKNLVGKRALDAGCGDGAAVEQLHEMGVKIVGLDRQLNESQKAKPGRYVEKDIRDTGYPDNYFDVTFSAFAVFHYSESPAFQREALTELARVTAKGGMLVLIQHGSREKLDFLVAEAAKLGLRKVQYEPIGPEGLPEALVFEK
jgi:SAM-dependent methyltransferase